VDVTAGKQGENAMLYRLLSLCLALVAAVLISAPVLADSKKSGDDKGTGGKSHSGWFVSAKGNKLVMKDKEGKNEHTHMVAEDAKITCDGKECKLSDLKKGTMIHVTVKKEGEHNVVTRVDATTKKRDGGKDRED